MSLLTAGRLSIGIAIVSAFFVLMGLYPIVDLLLPPRDIPHPISIQLALIRVSAHGPVHIAITFLMPFVSIVAGILFWLKRKSGWWLVALLSSFASVLYLLAIAKGRYVGALFEGYFLLPTSIDVELLSRVFLYVAAFIFGVNKQVMALYGLENTNQKRTISLLFLGNVIFAIVGYRLWD